MRYRPRSWNRANGLLLLSASAALTIAVLAPIARASEKPVTPLEITQVRSSDVVYVLATTGCAQPSCLRLYRTTVAAATFTSVDLPPIGTSQGTLSGTLLSMHFANVSDGYAIVGVTDPTTLYVTLNGARTWHRVTMGEDVTTLGLTTTANSIVAITGVCSRSGLSCHNYRIARSSLKAQRWTSSTMPIGRSGKLVWGFPYVPAAWGNDVWISEQPPGPAVIFVSRDGGTSFNRVVTPKLGSVNSCALIPESAVTLWAECPTGMQVSFFFSTDAGATWSSIPQEQFFGTAGGFFDPATSNLAYLDYGATGPLVRVATSPRSVTRLGALSCSKVNSSINGLIFDKAGNGFALCLPGDEQSRGRLERTTDGGFRWRMVVLEAG